MASNDAIVPLNRRLQIAVAERLDVVDSTHEHGSLQRIVGEAVVVGPRRWQAHRHEVGARGMAADGHPGRNSPVCVDVA